MRKGVITKHEGIALRKSIRHWKRMLKWAKKQPKDNPCTCSGLEMEDVIHEGWGGEYCPLCSLVSSGFRCPDCVLERIGKCHCNESTSPWKSVYHSDNWGEWVVAAEKMIAFMEEVKDHAIEPKKGGKE